jgi:hypothetical protein
VAAGGITAPSDPIEDVEASAERNRPAIEIATGLTGHTLEFIAYFKPLVKRAILRLLDEKLRLERNFGLKGTSLDRATIASVQHANE